MCLGNLRIRHEGFLEIVLAFPWLQQTTKTRVFYIGIECWRRNNFERSGNTTGCRKQLGSDICRKLDKHPTCMSQTFWQDEWRTTKQPCKSIYLYIWIYQLKVSPCSTSWVHSPRRLKNPPIGPASLTALRFRSQDFGLPANWIWINDNQWMDKLLPQISLRYWVAKAR